MKIKPFIFFFLIALIAIKISAQEGYTAIVKDTISFEDKIQKIDTLLQKKRTTNALEEYTSISKKYSTWLYRNKNYAKAIHAILESIVYHKGDSIELQKKKSLAGLYFFDNKDYLNSNIQYEGVIAIKNNNKRAGRAYSGIGRNYYYTGDYNLATKYYEAGGQLLSNLKDPRNLLRNYINVSNTYLNLGTKTSFQKLQNTLNNADSIASLLKDERSKNNILSLRAKYYTHYKIKDTSQQKGRQLLTTILDKALSNNDSILLSKSYNDLGILLNKANIEESTRSFFKASEYCPVLSPKLNINNFGNIAINKAKQKRFDSASLFLNKAISLLVAQKKTLEDVSYEHIITNKSINEQSWIIFQNAAEMYLLKYENTSNKNDLDKAIHFFKITDQLFDHFTVNTTETFSKLEWRKRASKMYSRALKACYLAQELTLANLFMEKNKAILLATEFEKKQRRQSLMLPQEIYTKELILKKKISALEKESDTKMNDVSHAQHILLAKKNLQKFTDSIEVIFPNYQPKELVTIKTLDDTQSLLKEDEINIQFHISEDDGYGIYPNSDNGYLLITTPSTIVFEEIKDLSKLRTHTAALLTMLQQPFKTEEDIATYNKYSLAMFDQLFISEEIKSLLRSKKATIIPDNYISLLPFEALITSNTPNSYLIKQTEISYVYSNSFQTNTSSNSKGKNSMLGMAPVTFESLGLATLHYSTSEIEKIETYFSGNFHQGKTATKQRFLDIINDYNLIHLVTHADAQEGSSPWIAFSDQKLELEDLYVTSNKASLVFLSGCNTTLGEQATGEGIMSLARGFFYAGSQSVIATLWSIDDKSTSEIAGYFYKNINDGQTKSKALHQAKLSYLENHSLAEVSPHFWASYILLGENNTITETSNLLLYTTLILVPFLLLLGFSLYKKKEIKLSFS